MGKILDCKTGAHWGGADQIEATPMSQNRALLRQGSVILSQYWRPKGRAPYRGVFSSLGKTIAALHAAKALIY